MDITSLLLIEFLEDEYSSPYSFLDVERGLETNLVLPRKRYRSNSCEPIVIDENKLCFSFYLDKGLYIYDRRMGRIASHSTLFSSHGSFA